MDWAVGVMLVILLPGGDRRPGWPCHQAMPGTAPRGWWPSLAQDSKPNPPCLRTPIPSPPDMVGEQGWALPGHPGPSTGPPPSSWLIPWPRRTKTTNLELVVPSNPKPPISHPPALPSPCAASRPRRATAAGGLLPATLTLSGQVTSQTALSSSCLVHLSSVSVPPQGHLLSSVPSSETSRTALSPQFWNPPPPPQLVGVPTHKRPSLTAPLHPALGHSPLPPLPGSSTPRGEPGPGHRPG